MRIFYFANVRVPTEKAHGVHIMKMCQSLAKQGIDLILVAPKRANRMKKEPFKYYGINNTFKIKKLFCLDWTVLFRLASFAFSSLVFGFLKIKKSDVIYSRFFFFLFLLSFFRSNYFYEMHTLPKNIFWYKLTFRRSAGLVVVTQKLKELLVKQGIAEDKILVAPDGVSIEDFNIDLTKSQCRQKLSLPLDKKIVLYTGHLFKWKGVQVLAEASRYLKDKSLIVFVGGTFYDIKKFKEKNANLKKILVIGHRPYKEMPFWLRSADVLVLPNSAKNKISQYYTSPIKMFEYMTSQRPIVASDLPSLREVLNANNAILVQSDNSQRLAQAINNVFEKPNLYDNLTQQAAKDANKYNWNNRAGNIIGFIKKQLLPKA